jgi:hypothetical protein
MVAWARSHKDSKDRAPEPLPALGALRGALAFRVRLKNGLSHTIEQPTSVPAATALTRPAGGPLSKDCPTRSVFPHPVKRLPDQRI